MISEIYEGLSGVVYRMEYEDCDDFSVLPYDSCRQIYGVCFTSNEQIVIVYNGKKDTWGLVGGTIESGETFDTTFRREVQEESNMEVLAWRPVGYQKVIDTRDNSYVYQLRVVANVRPYGIFKNDPAGSITKIALINPDEYKKYFDWKSIGEHLMSRAKELRAFL